MGEGEKYNFYVHSDIKEKVVIINITYLITESGSPHYYMYVEFLSPKTTVNQSFWITLLHKKFITLLRVWILFHLYHYDRSPY